MARLRGLTYDIPCTKRARLYFVSGFRRGYFLAVEHDDGHTSWGEFTPWAHVHQCDLATVIKIASLIQLNDVEALLKAELDDAVWFLQNLPYPLSYLLSMALFHYRFIKSVHNFESQTVPLAGLVEAPSITEALRIAQTYLAQGYLVLKIKVGQLPIAQEVKKITTILSMSEQPITLRLDANKSLNYKEAVALLKSLPVKSIEYFEEPLKDIAQTKNLIDECGINIAFDESYIPSIDELPSYIKYLIIKPSRFHNLFSLQKLATSAVSAQLIPIFSHGFESEFSSAISAVMIRQLNLTGYAHGIMTDDFFVRSIFKEPLRSVKGRVSLAQADNLLKGGLIFD